MSTVFYYWIPIGIALFSILQAIAHVWWVLYGRKLISCHVKVQQKVYFYLYLTYLYGNECDAEVLNDYASLNLTDTNIHFHFYNADGSITEELMNTYLVFDAIWIITSVSLLIGIMMHIKKCSAMIFFSPWMLVDFFMLILDMFSALYFGADLPKADVKIKGISEKIPTNVIMAIVSGKLGFIWVLNLVALFIILKVTHKFYNQREQLIMDRTDSENRIKNWLMFYGSASEDDLSYTKTFRDFEKQKDATIKDDFCSTFKSSSILTNNAPSSSMECVQQKPVKKKVQIMEELQGHFPWSYMDPPKKSASMDEKDK